MTLPEDFSVAIPAVLQDAPVGLLLTDKKKKIVWLNNALQNYLDIDFNEIKGATASSLKNDSLKALLKAKNIAELPATAIHERRWTKCWRAPLADENEGITAHYFFDVTELHQLHSENEHLKVELENLNIHDKTTGMLNQHGLMQTLESQVSRSRRYNNPLSLIILETGGVKDKKNLDQVLVAISLLLNDQLRWADLAGRLDTNRFLLILPETSAKDTVALADKLTTQIKAIEKAPKGLIIKSATSSWEKGDDIDKLMSRAEKGLK